MIKQTKRFFPSICHRKNEKGMTFDALLEQMPWEEKSCC
jgi:hypothetical protein